MAVDLVDRFRHPFLFNLNLPRRLRTLLQKLVGISALLEHAPSPQVGTFNHVPADRDFRLPEESAFHELADREAVEHIPLVQLCRRELHLGASLGVTRVARNLANTLSAGSFADGLGVSWQRRPPCPISLGVLGVLAVQFGRPNRARRLRPATVLRFASHTNAFLQAYPFRRKFRKEPNPRASANRQRQPSTDRRATGQNRGDSAPGRPFPAIPGHTALGPAQRRGPLPLPGGRRKDG
jgi:hypothetical protein